MASPFAALLGTAVFSVPLALLCVATLGGVLRVLRRLRLMEDIATSAIGSAAQGYVELHGTAECIPGAEQRSPLGRQVCFWWSCRISECDLTTPLPRWRVVREDRYRGPFVLRDASGRCLVLPDGAEQIGQALLGGGQAYIGSGDTAQPPAAALRPGSQLAAGVKARYRYEENLLLPGLALYALGSLRTERPTADAQPAALLLAQLRQHAGDSATRSVSLPSDWADAIRHDGLHTLGHPADGRPLLLSDQSQQELRDGSALLIGALLACGLLSATLFVWVIDATLAGKGNATIVAALIGTLLGTLALLIGGGLLVAAGRVALGRAAPLPWSAQVRRQSRWQIVPLLLLGLGLGGLCALPAYWKLQAAGIF